MMGTTSTNGHEGAESELSALLKLVTDAEATKERLREIAQAMLELAEARKEFSGLQELAADVKRRERLLAIAEENARQTATAHAKTDKDHAERVRVLDRREADIGKREADHAAAVNAQQEQLRAWDADLTARQEQLTAYKGELDHKNQALVAMARDLAEKHRRLKEIIG